VIAQALQQFAALVPALVQLVGTSGPPVAAASPLASTAAASPPEPPEAAADESAFFDETSAVEWTLGAAERSWTMP
jgi:hypothetical protein